VSCHPLDKKVNCVDIELPVIGVTLHVPPDGGAFTVRGIETVAGRFSPAVKVDNSS